MNSFWIPQLGGQVYAMSGMSTKLNLIANETGVYKGVSANVSGKGFADMHFDAHAIPKRSFESWVKATHDNDNHFTQDTYDELAKPGKASVQAYHLHGDTIYQNAIMKYMNRDGGNTQPPHDDTYKMTTHDKPEAQ
jgi:cytochrome o ubiquinol oxidase subunit 2